MAMASKSTKFVTQIQFAKIIGRSRSWVTQLKQAGRLVLNEKGLVDVEASNLRIQQTEEPNRDDVKARHEEGRETKPAEPAKPKVKKISDSLGFQNARAREQEMKAKMAELDYAERLGQLVSKADMKIAVADMVTTFRSNIENMPHRIAADLVGKDIADIRLLLKQAIHHELTTLERGLTEKLNQQPEVA
jgi:hypothetical protein